MALTEKQKFILAVLVVLLVVWILWRASRPRFGIVYLVYADWCGHCNRLKPIWNDMKNEMNGEIIFIDVNEKDTATVEQLTSQYGIEVSAYPTVFKINRHGRVSKYDGFTNGKHDVNYLRNYLGSPEN